MSPKRRPAPDSTPPAEPSSSSSDPRDVPAEAAPARGPDAGDAGDPGDAGDVDGDAEARDTADAAEGAAGADREGSGSDEDAGSDAGGGADRGGDAEGGDAEGGDPEGGEAEGGEAEPGADGAEGGRRRAKKADGPPPPPERLEGAVEALLLAAGEALTAERIRDLLGLPSALHVREAVEAIRTRWKAAGLAVEIQDVAGGHRVVTRPEYAEYVRRFWRRPAADRLSATLLETLSIVAYKQPVARAEIERIRGVQCGEALRQLLDRRLLKVSGRSDQPGRPLLYATTVRFLEVFGLAGLEDLPNAKDLARL